VEFQDSNYDGDDAWNFDPDIITAGNSSNLTVIFKLNDVPLDQHNVGFYVNEIQYVDDDGNIQTLDNTPDDPQDLSDYAYFDDDQATTDSNGQASDNLEMADDDTIIYIEVTWFDATVWDSDDGPGD
jgi:hypothetical protein